MKKIFFLIGFVAIFTLNVFSQINIFNLQRVYNGTASWGITTTDNGYVFILKGGGLILKSTNNGAQYSYSNTPLTYPTGNYLYLKIFANSNSLFLCTYGDNAGVFYGRGVYRSDDFANTWVKKNNGLGADTNVVSFAVLANGAILVFTYNYTAKKVFRSTDNGETWTFIKNVDNAWGANVTVKSATEAYMCDDEIYKSIDNGASWTDITPTSGPAASGLNRIQISSAGVLYGNQNYSLLKSTDGGSTWTTIITTGIQSSIYLSNLFKIPGDTFIIGYTNSPYDLLYSTDECVTWNTLWDQGSLGNLLISSTGYLFATMSAIGIYRSALPITASHSGVEEYSLRNSFNIYPNPFTNILTICLNKNVPELGVIEIIDLRGEIIYSSYQMIQQLNEIDISNIPSGIYFIKTRTSESTYVERVIKM